MTVELIYVKVKSACGKEEKVKHEVTAQRLRMALYAKGIKAQELADGTGLGKSSISQYVNGTHSPSNLSAGRMAEVLDVNPLWLMGYDVPMESLPVGVKKLPVLGRIACGEPILMSEERDLYVVAGTEVKADFVLIARGDSMVDARIRDGDLVFIRQQPTVENGEIAAVAVGEECLLKRFYREGGRITLISANPKYPPMIFDKDIRVLGKAVAFQSDLD